MDCSDGIAKALLGCAVASEHDDNEAVRREGGTTTSAGNARRSALLGSSPAILAIAMQVEAAAATDHPVLITGELGVGKECVARAVHGASPRAEGDFAVVNCAALGAARGPEGLSRIGPNGSGGTWDSTERRNGGTLFLDGIENLPSEFHAPVLAMLQQWRPQDDASTAARAGHRVIVASRLSPTALRRSGEFGRQLHAEPNLLHLHVPPLRDRREDIAPLAVAFVEQFARESGCPPKLLSPQALVLLQNHSWPGNLRELSATIQCAVLRSHSEEIEPADLGLEAVVPEVRPVKKPPERPAPGTTAEREMLLDALRSTAFNITKTAQGLSVSRVTLYRMLRRNRLMLRHDCVVWGQSDDDQEQASDSADTKPPVAAKNGELG